MAAEQLPLLIECKDDEVCCEAPSLDLLKGAASSDVDLNSRQVLEDAAATNLALPMQMKRSELPDLPFKLLWNLSRSFLFLVESRLRSSLTALLERRASSCGSRDDPLSRTLTRLMGDGSSAISPTAIVSTFRTVGYAECTEDGDLVLPLVMECVLDLTVLGVLVPITVEAPGTIQGSFDSLPGILGIGKLKRVEVVIDSTELLQSMMAEARSVVDQALVRASAIASRLILSHSVTGFLDASPSIKSSSTQPTSESSSTHGTSSNQDMTQDQSDDRKPSPSASETTNISTSPGRPTSLAGSFGASLTATLNTTSIRPRLCVERVEHAVAMPSGLSLLTAAMSQVNRVYDNEEEDKILGIKRRRVSDQALLSSSSSLNYDGRESTWAKARRRSEDSGSTTSSDNNSTGQVYARHNTV